MEILLFLSSRGGLHSYSHGPVLTPHPCGEKEVDRSHFLRISSTARAGLPRLVVDRLLRTSRRLCNWDATAGSGAGWMSSSSLCADEASVFQTRSLKQARWNSESQESLTGFWPSNASFASLSGFVGRFYHVLPPSHYSVVERRQFALFEIDQIARQEVQRLLLLPVIALSCPFAVSAEDNFHLSLPRCLCSTEQVALQKIRHTTKYHRTRI